MNLKQMKTNTMKGIGNHSTLITFIAAGFGVALTAIFAAREIPKAKEQVKEILEKEDLTKTQKVTESAKVVAKTTWKTAVIALGTVLLVTGTSAITTANTAATVAGLTSTVNLLEQKYKDATEAIDDIPDKKIRNQVKNNVTQKMINRATADMSDEQFARDEKNPDMYIWVSKFEGVRLKATYKMIDNLEKLVDAEITNKGYARVADVYDLLVSLGAEIIWDEDQDDYYDVDYNYGWNGGFECKHEVFINDYGHTVYSIEFSEPSTSF